MRGRRIGRGAIVWIQLAWGLEKEGSAGIVADPRSRAGGPPLRNSIAGGISFSRRIAASRHTEPNHVEEAGMRIILLIVGLAASLPALADEGM